MIFKCGHATNALRLRPLHYGDCVSRSAWEMLGPGCQVEAAGERAKKQGRVPSSETCLWVSLNVGGKGELSVRRVKRAREACGRGDARGRGQAGTVVVIEA